MLSGNSKDNEVKQVWNKYYPALLKHENGHANIAIKGAEKIENTLMSQPAGSSCDKVGEYADLQARKILESLPEKHRSYDRDTDHGKTQGAYIWLYL